MKKLIIIILTILPFIMWGQSGKSHAQEIIPYTFSVKGNNLTVQLQGQNPVTLTCRVHNRHYYHNNKLVAFGDAKYVHLTRIASFVSPAYAPQRASN
jgi:hypothetical protein